MLNSGHSDGDHHRSHILELVELDELGVFFVIQLIHIVEGVNLSAWLRPLFVESRVCFEPKLHLEYQLHYTISLNRSSIMVTLIITSFHGVNDYSCFLRALRHYSTSS